MTKSVRMSAIAVAMAVAWPFTAQAQTAGEDGTRQELAAMRAQMERMAQRIDTLENQLAATQAKADGAQAAADAATTKVLAAQTVTTKVPTEIAWDGGPRLTGKDGWSFKPRGRLQVDSAGVDAPAGIASARRLGITTELRRAYMGVDGTLPGGFGYRIEADFANNTAELTDIFLTYKVNPEVTLTLGQQKPFDGMEDLTSDLFTSFLERAAFNSAFGFERRVGVSATYSGKTLLVQAGVFTDNARDLDDVNNSYSVDGRIVFMPKLGSGQLHLGGSAHYRDFNDAPHFANYQARPFAHTTDLRLVGTGNITPVDGEHSFGLEAAYIRGRFHATAESHWLTAKRPGLPDPTFNGGYGEVGLLLTDDQVAYRAGIYDRIRPRRPLGKDGIGAIQANLRYEWLDLIDAGIVGGRQQIGGVSLVWTPTDYVRFILNYGHIWVDQAVIAAAGDRDYAADSLGMRAQFDF